MSLTGIDRQFAAWLTERHYSPATIVCYVGYVRRAEHAVGELFGASADAVYDWWTTLPGTASSRNGGRKALIAFYRSRGDRTGGPAAELPAWPDPDRRPRPVAPAAFAALQAAAARLGGVHHVAAVLLGSTGCRVSEARLARWDQFTFDVERSAWRIVGKGARCRGPKERPVPLHPATVRVLTGWQADCSSRTWVFPSPMLAGRPLSDSTMRTVVYDIAAAAGVDEHVNPHRWRHSVGTTALEGTGNLAAVQELLGHANPATTRRYAAVSLDRMREAVDVVVAAASYGAPALHAVV
jgi:integrase